MEEEVVNKPVVKKTLAQLTEQYAQKENIETPPPPPEGTLVEKPPVVVVPPETFNPVKYFNEKFNTKFEKEDEFTTHFSSLNERATKAEQLEQDIESERTKAKQLVDESVTEFKNQFGITDDMLKFFKAKSEFPEADPNVLSRVLNSDFNETLKSDPVEILLIKERLENPELTEEQALRRVYKQYGIDPEIKDDNGAVEIDEDAAINVKIEAKKAVRNFAEIKDKVKLPDAINIAAKKEADLKIQTEKYNTIKPLLEKEFKKIPDNLDKVEIFKENTKNGKTEKELVFSFSLGDYAKSTHVKKEIEQAVDYLSRTMPEFNAEFVEKALTTSAETLKAQRILSQLPDMFIAAREQWRAEFRKEANIEEHNPNGINTEGNPNIPKTDEQKKRDEGEAKVVAQNPKLKTKEVWSR